MRLACVVADYRGTAQFLTTLARAVDSADDIGIKLLLVLVRDSEPGGLQRYTADKVAALEEACAAKGIAVEVRI